MFLSSTSFVFDDSGPLTTPVELGLTGTVSSSETVVVDGVQFLTPVPRGSANELQGHIAPGERKRVSVDVKVKASARSNDDFLESNELVFALDICSGCLVPTCADGERLVGDDDACLRGVDVAAHCEPEP